jgi:hypothetical protein
MNNSPDLKGLQILVVDDNADNPALLGAFRYPDVGMSW